MSYDRYDPLDLSDPRIKEEFSKYILYWINRNGETLDSFASKSGLSVKQLRRYIPGPQRSLPQRIPLKTYNDLLATLGKTSDDFYRTLPKAKQIELCVNVNPNCYTSRSRESLLKTILTSADSKGGALVRSVDEILHAESGIPPLDLGLILVSSKRLS